MCGVTGGIRGFELLEPHRAARVHPLLECVRRQRQRRRRQHQAPRRAGQVEVLVGLLRVAQQAPAPRTGIVHDDQRVVGQKVEHALHAAQQQGRERLRPRWHVPAQQRVDELVHAAGRELLLRRQAADLFGAVDHQRAIDQKLPGRRRHDVAERSLRALAGRIEFANRFDFVRQQLRAHGVCALRGEEVENAAAHRQLAALFHQGHARVARRQERLDQGVAVHALPDLEVHGAPPHQLPRGYARRQRRPGRHHNRARLGRAHAVTGRRTRQPAIERIHTLGHHEGLGREALVGLGVVAREGAHPVALGRLAQRGAQVIYEGVARLGRGHEHQHGAIPVRARQVRHHHRARGAAQPGEPHGTIAFQHAPDHVRQLANARSRCDLTLDHVPCVLRTHESPAARRRGGPRGFGTGYRSEGNFGSRRGARGAPGRRG
jgi:hypothetical protein